MRFRGAGGSLLSAEALLVCMAVGRDGERVRPFLFARLAVPFLRTVGSGWEFWRLSTLSSGTIGMHVR